MGCLADLVHALEHARQFPRVQKNLLTANSIAEAYHHRDTDASALYSSVTFRCQQALSRLSPSGSQDGQLCQVLTHSCS